MSFFIVIGWSYSKTQQSGIVEVGMKKNEGGKKQKKPEYGLGSNLLYMVRHAAEFPSVLWLLGIETAAGVAVSVTTLYMAPSFLRCVEAHDSFRKMLLVLLFFSLGMIGFNGL